MAGVKGRSGRKSSRDDFSASQLLNTCVKWLNDNFDTFTKDEKMKVVLTIAPKAISDKHEHSGLETAKVSIVHNYVSTNGTNGNRIADTVQPEADKSLEHTS